MNALKGLAAGAVGTTVLNMVTYTDMTLRGRASSEVPSKVVEELAGAVQVEALTGDTDKASNRRSGAGALLGYATGLGVGLVYGLSRSRFSPGLIASGVGLAAAAIAIGDAPATAMKITNPREWSMSGWISDIVPHLAFGFATAAAYDLLSR